jgi:hypothetical protein
MYWVAIHIYMEMSQENSLCSYLKQTKMSFFSFLLQNQRTGGQNRSCLGIGTTEREDDIRKGYRR